MPKNPSASYNSITSQDKLINFTQAGTIIGTYAYCFGEYLWSLKVKFEDTLSLASGDISGIMIVGVLNKKANVSHKIVGSIINYTLTGGEIKIKVHLDVNQRTMTVYTNSKPEGEHFTDLPKDGMFFPAIQNKTQKFTKNAKLYVSFNFDIPIPENKSEIGLLDEENQHDLRQSQQNLMQSRQRFEMRKTSAERKTNDEIGNTVDGETEQN